MISQAPVDLDFYESNLLFHWSWLERRNGTPLYEAHSQDLEMRVFGKTGGDFVLLKEIRQRVAIAPVKLQHLLGAGTGIQRHF